MGGFKFVNANEQEPVDASYLQARIDAVQNMFDKLDYVRVDMVAVVLGVSLEAYKARQAKIMEEDVENDVD